MSFVTLNITGLYTSDPELRRTLRHNHILQTEVVDAEIGFTDGDIALYISNNQPRWWMHLATQALKAAVHMADHPDAHEITVTAVDQLHELAKQLDDIILDNNL